MSTGESWPVLLQIFGRAHPVLLHLPFGLLLALAVLEIIAKMLGRPLEASTRKVLAGLALLACGMAASSGWFLGEEGDYSGELVDDHRQLGLWTAGVTLVMAFAAWRSLRKLYVGALVVAFILLLSTGHHGGSLTHGEGFLLEPLRAEASPAVSPSLSGAQQEIPSAQPLLIQYCGKCHGEGRQRGGLTLHAAEGIRRGGDSGPVLDLLDAQNSPLLQRLRLPLEHDDHMPPASKPQPTVEQLEAIARWVVAGLPSGPESALAAMPEHAAALDGARTSGEATASEARAEPVNQSDVSENLELLEHIASLRAQQVHVEVSDPERGLLRVDFAPRSETDDAAVAELVATLGPWVDSLCLARTQVSDAALVSIASLPSLQDLDLSGTAVTSQGLRSLEHSAHLGSLNLTGTSLDEQAVHALSKFPALMRLSVWGTGLSAEQVARLREFHPACVVEDGSDLFAEALEIEPELKLQTPAPPVNSQCPVTGREVDPRFTAEHEGAVVGFCCGSCPDTFAEDPSAYPLTLAGPRLGMGAHSYEWVPDWLELPDGRDELGNTHGEIVVDRRGHLHLNTDTTDAIMEFDSSGSFVRSWGEEFAEGLHGMQLVEEQGEEFLYFVHFGRHEFVKATLAGEILWRMGPPMESGKYESADQFRPTSIAVAPDGGFFVADGYGQNWVHQYDAERRWVRSLGGHGTDPGSFRTPHGVWVDTRASVPELIVADRENSRLQRFGLEGQWLGLIEGMLRRPCKIQQQGEFLVIPDLAGRVTILNGKNELVTQLGDNPDVGRRANNGVPRGDWKNGEFLAPHSAVWDAAGNLYVMDWNRHGRITKLRRLAR